jgi:membrane peptidoglycan carboxypeptidase
MHFRLSFTSIFRKFRQLPRRRKILLGILTLMLAMGVFVYFWLFADLPSIDRLQAGLALPSTRIYDRNGQLLYEILPADGGRNTARPTPRSKRLSPHGSKPCGWLLAGKTCS